MDGYTLPPDLEQFAADEVMAGRFSDTADVVRAAMELLRRQRTEVAAFVRSLEEAEAEAERDGWVTIDQVMADADAVLAEMRRAG